jgi:hypothetical protein
VIEQYKVYMRKNNMKLAVAMTLAVFTIMTALVTMQTIPAFAAFCTSEY